jgi:effector-binding domain-containing protein
MKTTEPKITEKEPLHYMGIRTQVTLQEMGQGVVPELYGEIMTWLKKQDLAPSGGPFIRYHVINMEEKMDIEMCWPVAQPLSGNERIRPGVLPAGRYASLIYTGIMNGLEGNGVLIRWGIEKGLKWDSWPVENGEAFASRFELERTDPADEPDMAKWEIEVAIRLADDQP